MKTIKTVLHCQVCKNKQQFVFHDYALIAICEKCGSRYKVENINFNEDRIKIIPEDYVFTVPDKKSTDASKPKITIRSKICPFQKDSNCYQADCGLWNDTDGYCSFLSVALTLERIAYAL